VCVRACVRACMRVCMSACVYCLDIAGIHTCIEVGLNDTVA